LDIFKADWLERTELKAILDKQAKSTGFRSKKPIEFLEGFKVVLRPFRKITLNVSRSRIDESYQTQTLIDEELFPHIADENHQMLLWRPKYIDGNFISEDLDYESNADEEALQSIIDAIMEKRWKSQEYDDEIRPKLKRLQMDPLGAIAFLIPRTAGGLRKEQAIIDDSKESRAYILATSLLTNCSPKDIIISADLGETVLIETVIAEYGSQSDSSRLLALETPGTNSFDEAIKAGKALTRLCELYGECREIVSNATK